MCGLSLAFAPTVRLWDRLRRYRRARFVASDAVKLDDSAAKEKTDIVRFDVPGVPEMLPVIRSRVADFARTMPFTEEEVQDIKLAVGEASANAVKHGAGGDSCSIEIEMEKQPSALKISVSDHGCGFDPEKAKVARNDRLDESGRGITVMRAVMDEVNFLPGNPGTRVELLKRLKR
ncbi:MAG: ATP-binding protein [Armatimonadota bacterium]|nr:ATP-binding protein [Armatimonadota bacterium]